MSELCARLETIGIGQYGDAFDANESGTDLLGQVDDPLLKDIGVSIGGQITLGRALMAAKAVAQSQRRCLPAHDSSVRSWTSCPIGPILIGQSQHRLV
jgi:hypothetical protein